MQLRPCGVLSEHFQQHRCGNSNLLRASFESISFSFLANLTSRFSPFSSLIKLLKGKRGNGLNNSPYGSRSFAVENRCLVWPLVMPTKMPIPILSLLRRNLGSGLAHQLHCICRIEKRIYDLYQVKRQHRIDLIRVRNQTDDDAVPKKGNDAVQCTFCFCLHVIY